MKLFYMGLSIKDPGNFFPVLETPMAMVGIKPIWGH